MRGRAYRRAVRNRAILKRRGILVRVHGRNYAYRGWPCDGKLAKGKIHCSCWMCSQKTNKHGWRKSDLVKMAEVPPPSSV